MAHNDAHILKMSRLILEMERAEGLKQVAQVRAEIYNPGVYN